MISQSLLFGSDQEVAAAVLLVALTVPSRFATRGGDTLSRVDILGGVVDLSVVGSSEDDSAER